jgi:hypothetical protein
MISWFFFLINPLAWPLGFQCALAGGVLIALSFYLPFFKEVTRYVGIALLVLGAAYQKGRADCNAIHDAANLRAENAILVARLRVVEDLGIADARRAEADAIEIKRLEELTNASPPNPAACGDRGLPRRLRRIH